MNRELFLRANEALGGVFDVAIARRDIGLCPTCGGQIGSFRDERSTREFRISGMCQECQDSLFDESEDMS
jgi:hypothetical protein